jgi:hypothetical protein
MFFSPFVFTLLSVAYCLFYDYFPVSLPVVAASIVAE